MNSKRWKFKTVSLERGEQGFTLLELLVTIGIVMVLSAIGIPKFMGAISNYKLTAAVQQAELAIQTTRYQAIQNGYPYQVAIDPTTNTYQELNYPAGATAFANVGGSVPVSTAPITISAATTYQFSPNGSVIAPVGAMSFSIQYQGNTKTLTVSNYGSISVQ
jgi:prepilin-type N-terminal cleavage/methylation domain-containing protein